MNNNFDPYDLLITALERIDRLENAHNKLVHAHQRMEAEFNTALKSLQHLQRSQAGILMQQNSLMQQNAIK